MLTSDASEALDEPPAVAARATLGRAVGLAQRALLSHLDGVLVESATPRRTWFALSRLVAMGGERRWDAFVGDFADAVELEPSAVVALLDEMIGAGLLQVSSEAEDVGALVSLTNSGSGLHRRVLTAILLASDDLLSPFDPAEVDNLIRLLLAITDRIDKQRSLFPR